MKTSIRLLLFCAVILSIDVQAQKWRFQRYRYNPWTGRTTSVEEFDQDVQNMDQKQLSRYMNELRRVKNGLNQMRRESEILERELGFRIGGFPSLMENSENIINHALDSVTDQLQQRIGHYEDPQELEMRRKFDQKVKTADRPTLMKNLDRLKDTKRELTEAKNRAEALKNDLGFELQGFPKAMERAENIINHGMEVINNKLNKQEQPKVAQQQHLNQDNISKTINKVDDAIRTADKRQLANFGNEFKKMKNFMDNVRNELRTFHNDIGFEFDGIFEPFKMADSILEHGLKTINKQLLASGSGPAHGPSGSGDRQNQAGQQQGTYNQQNSQQGAYNQQNHQADGQKQDAYNQHQTAAYNS